MRLSSSVHRFYNIEIKFLIMSLEQGERRYCDLHRVSLCCLVSFLELKSVIGLLVRTLQEAKAGL